MPTSDLSSSLGIECKAVTTYGTQNVFSRALQAVKDVVPSKLIPGGSEDREIPTLSGDELDQHHNFPVSPEITNDFEDAGLGKGGSNGASDDGTNGARNGNGQRRDQDPSRRTSKRLRDEPGHLVGTPSGKRRRKYKAEAGAEGQDELQKEQNPLTTSRSSQSRNVRRNGHIEQEGGGGNKRPGSETSPHVNGKRPNGRLRRRRRRLSPEVEQSLVKSTPRKARTSKIPSSTPSRRRGRPPKSAITTPTSRGIEEVGPGNKRSSKRGLEKSRRGHEDVRSGHMNGAKQSLTRTRRIPADPADPGGVSDGEVQVGDGGGYSSARSAHPNTLSEPLQDPELDSGDPFELQKDVEGLTTLQQSFNKLQRLIRSFPTDSVNLFKSELLRDLNSPLSALVNMDDEYRKVQQLVTQTVLAGEGNSMLVVGPRGCGKTALVETVLSDMVHEHGDDFIVVRLNGFIHTDDKLALREIWRQLGREVAAEEEAGGIRINYADTLTSLLALLAHSPEDEGKMDEIARSVVFVIDEFDLFASHPRQTLLYNLFDVAQSRNAPIAVLGLTTRTDIVESLEKRVKSRFGQRYVYLAHPRTFASFQNMCKSALASQASARSGFHDRLGIAKTQVTKLRAAWNDYMDVLFASDPELEKSLRRLFAMNKCVASFRSSCYLPIRLVSASNIPTGASLVEQSLLPSDSKLQLLPSLSDLELSLLIAAARLDVVLDTDVCNFSMVYDEYVQLASRVKAQSSAAGQTAVGGGTRVWGQEVALGAWEKLMELELVLPISTGVGGDGSRNMCKADVALEEIGPSCPRLSATMSKWCREI
ncbi:MAG: hypothetical protein L6R39_006607 [Caloplaca ligustica]|nr:MAG: hypothetical protein L6R39_006607 [Caloplaca ligustica]